MESLYHSVFPLFNLMTLLGKCYFSDFINEKTLAQGSEMM